MKIQIVFTLLLVLLAGCQTTVMVRSNDSSTYRVTEVKLLQSLTVSSETTRVFVQDGKVLVRGSDADQYRPQCAIEVRDRMESDQIIPSGRFWVTRVQSVMEEVVEWKPVQVAGLILADMDDGGAPQVHAGYHFWFGSDKPEVRRMTCYGLFAEIQEVGPPTIEDIRQALGGIAELILQ